MLEKGEFGRKCIGSNIYVMCIARFFLVYFKYKKKKANIFMSRTFFTFAISMHKIRVFFLIFPSGDPSKK